MGPRALPALRRQPRGRSHRGEPAESVCQIRQRAQGARRAGQAHDQEQRVWVCEFRGRGGVFPGREGYAGQVYREPSCAVAEEHDGDPADGAE